MSESGQGEGSVVRALIAKVGPEELAQRKAWLDLAPPDVDVIQRVGQAAVADQDQIVEAHLRHFQEDPHTADSFSSETVVVGIQPEVAFAMSQLGLTLEDARTALDLDAALELLGGH